MCRIGNLTRLIHTLATVSICITIHDNEHLPDNVLYCLLDATTETLGNKFPADGVDAQKVKICSVFSTNGKKSLPAPECHRR